MGNGRSACAVAAGAAVIALAGCGTAVSTSDAAGGSPAASASAPAAASASTSPAETATASATADSGPVVSPASLPFPIALGNTWVYQTVAAIDNAHALVTRRVMAVDPVATGHRVTMTEIISSRTAPIAAREDYLFYADGRIGYPLHETGGVWVVSSGGITWPTAADLASGRVYRSTDLVRLINGNDQTADVTVQGGGTSSVTVPAGTYRATLVIMTVTTTLADFTSTAIVKVWTSAQAGPVKSEEFVRAGGKTQLKSTEELVRFAKG